MNRARLYFLFFIFYFLHLRSLCSYSVFSGTGLGEPVEIPILFKPLLPRDFTFGCFLLFESIETSGNRNFDFTIPHFNLTLPLAKKITLDAELNELLNLNFDVQDEWRKFGDDSVQYKVKGRGSVSVGEIGICKEFSLIDGERGEGSIGIEIGGFGAFGSAIEEWIIDFGKINDTYDTLRLKFFGTGWIGSFFAEIWRFNLKAKYSSSSTLTSASNLPSRFVGVLFLKVQNNMRIGGEIENWQWKSPFKPMKKISIGSEYLLNQFILQGKFYTTNWYYDVYEYGAIKEKVGSMGIGVSLKSLCKINLIFELGIRENSIIKEKIFKVYLFIQGKEVF